MVRKAFNRSNVNLALPTDISLNRSSQPGSSAVSLASSTVSSTTNTDVEDNIAEGMEFKSVNKGEKKKLTRAQLKEREVRRRLGYLDWMISPGIFLFCRNCTLCHILVPHVDTLRAV
jgi:elongation factor 3